LALAVLDENWMQEHTTRIKMDNLSLSNTAIYPNTLLLPKEQNEATKYHRTIALHG
jgi:hypothetical protein